MTRLAFALLLLPLCGCHGWAPMWSQANPETSFSIDPLSRKIYFYSNDGRALAAEDLEFGKDADGKLNFKVKKLNITERSVENRVANAQQLEMVAKVTEAAMQPVRDLVQAVASKLGAPRESSTSITLPGIGTIEHGSSSGAPPVAPEATP